MLTCFRIITTSLWTTSPGTVFSALTTVQREVFMYPSTLFTAVCKGT